MLSIFRFNLRSLVLLILIVIVLITAVIFNLDNRYNIPRPSTLRIPDIPSFKSGFFNGQSRPPPPLEDHFPGSGQEPSTLDSAIDGAQTEPHYIDELVRRATGDFEKLMSRETHGVHESAEAYRIKRGRHPPPGFDNWVTFAEEVNATIVEDLFDQIYHDLGPFWGVPASQMRAAVDAWPFVISVRGGSVGQRTDRERDNMNAWQNMVSQIAHMLPDLDMAVNEMDESRLFATWDTVTHYINVGNEKRKQYPIGSFQSISEYPTLPPPEYDMGKYNHELLRSTPIWSLVAAACPHSAPGRRLPSEPNLHWSPAFPREVPEGSYNGYVANFTHASDPCMHPHLRGLHGSFIEPISISTSQKLFPLFGSSKLPQNNDILLPPAEFWTESDTINDELRQPWAKKSPTVFWRGHATGGRNRMPTWARFHRHRFVGASNGTAILAAEALQAHDAYPSVFPDLPPDTWIYTFQLPNPDQYNLTAMANGRLGAWTAQHSDVGFTHMECFPAERAQHGALCSYTSPFHELKNWVNWRDHFDHKYLPDIDGNVGGTPRFPSALRSTSVPMKATIYQSWLSTRVMPWKHFIPMDNTYKDYWGIMEYFLGYDDSSLASTQFTGFRSGPSRESKDKGKPDTAYDAEQDAVRAFAGREWGNIRVPEAEAAANAAARAHGHAITSPRPTQDDVAAVRQREADDATERRALARKSVPAHDEVGAWIAEGGARWARRTLRREDALVYVYRLLLEYARCSSENRDRMGYTADLQGAGGLQ